MKILILDIETAPNLAAVWGLWDQNVSLGQLLDSSYVLCWSAKWLGEKNIKYMSVRDDGEKEMLKGIHALLEEADAVVHYNGTRFDIPTLNKEFVQAGMGPPAPFKQIDLMRVVKKQFRFPSNKLDYVCKALGLGTKVEHKGHELFIKCMMDNDPAAWKLMKKYNKQDVNITEQLYDRILPWIHNHPNVGLYVDSLRPVCPRCGSTKLGSRGSRATSTLTYERYRCKSCGGWARAINSNRNPERRQRLLVSVND
jgi:DNA polymerase elongation subunit (family B)